MEEIIQKGIMFNKIRPRTTWTDLVEEVEVKAPTILNFYAR